MNHLDLASRKIRVLIVDDSGFFRRQVMRILDRCEKIQVVGTAANGQEGVRLAQSLSPDLITMDVDMPMMDGIEAVRRIMTIKPTPILMLSALTHEGAKATLEALAAGAMDFLPKHQETIQGTEHQSHLEDILVPRVLALASRRFMLNRFGPVASPSSSNRQVGRPVGRFGLVLIGASTGGPMALQTVLSALRSDFRFPLAIAIHMPAAFTPAFAERLNDLCHIRVKHAEDRDRLEPGLALLAPGGKQMLIDDRGAHTQVRIVDSQPGQSYHPSVDVLLNSAAESFRGKALAVILTGMGADGKQGAAALKNKGGQVWSQNEASCVVYGMPQAVEKAGLSDRVLALSEIGAELDRQS